MRILFSGTAHVCSRCLQSPILRKAGIRFAEAQLLRVGYYQSPPTLTSPLVKQHLFHPALPHSTLFCSLLFHCACFRRLSSASIFLHFVLCICNSLSVLVNYVLLCSLLFHSTMGNYYICKNTVLSSTVFPLHWIYRIPSQTMNKSIAFEFCTPNYRAILSPTSNRRSVLNLALSCLTPVSCCCLLMCFSNLLLSYQRTFIDGWGVDRGYRRQRQSIILELWMLWLTTGLTRIQEVRSLKNILIYCTRPYTPNRYSSHNGFRKFILEHT